MAHRFRGLTMAVFGALASALVLASVAGATHAGFLQLGHTNATPAGEVNDVTCSATTGSQRACLRAQNNTAGTDPTNPPRALEGIITAPTGNGIAVLGQSLSSDTSATGVYGWTTNGAGVKGLAAGTGNGVWGAHLATSGTFAGVLGTTDSTSSFAVGVRGRVRATTGGGGSAGVLGDNASPSGHGVLGTHDSGGSGVTGISETGFGVQGQHQAATGDKPGVSGTTASATDLAAGVKGETTGGGGLVAGVYGSSPTGIGLLGIGGSYGVLGYNPSGLAGLFFGNLHVQGTLSKSAGSFRIDHPLDKSKFLQHSFVESPDMMNVYNGNVRTDARGFATVRLPRYFQALNRDFRYQLTVVGTRGWRARVVREIHGNSFRIQSDVPLTRVSWQVTGIRHDAYANAHRIRPEIAKSAVDTASLRPAQMRELAARSAP